MNVSRMGDYGKTNTANEKLINHIFNDILKIPIMSHYHHNEETIYVRYNPPHPVSHIGKCRHICVKCSGVKGTVIHPYSDRVHPLRGSHRRSIARTTRVSPLYMDVRCSTYEKDIEKVRNANHSWYECSNNPICNTCKYIATWKRENWKRYMEKAIHGGVSERKELRRIYYTKDERRRIRRILGFFDDLNNVSLRDALIDVVDYLYNDKEHKEGDHIPDEVVAHLDIDNEDHEEHHTPDEVLTHLDIDNEDHEEHHTPDEVYDEASHLGV